MSSGSAKLTAAGVSLFNGIIKKLKDADDESWGLKGVSKKTPVYWSTDHTGTKWVMFERSSTHHGDGQAHKQYFGLAAPMKGLATATHVSFVSKSWKDHKGKKYRIPVRAYGFYAADGTYLGSGASWGKGTMKDVQHALMQNALFGSKAGKIATLPETVVRLKIVGGTDRSTLFKGHDSKGRAKYELPIPAGKTAHDVAKSIKAVAKAGAHEVLGGTVYAIRFFTPGKGEFDYWKAK